MMAQGPARYIETPELMAGLSGIAVQTKYPAAGRKGSP
jgi:hypothetical protein